MKVAKRRKRQSPPADNGRNVPLRDHLTMQMQPRRQVHPQRGLGRIDSDAAAMCQCTNPEVAGSFDLLMTPVRREAFALPRSRETRASLKSLRARTRAEHGRRRVGSL